MLTSLKTCIDSLPVDQNIEICLFTFDTAITFYNVGPSGEISLLHVGEVDDPFIPLPLNRLLLDIGKDREKIDTVIDKIFNMFTN